MAPRALSLARMLPGLGAMGREPSVHPVRKPGTGAAGVAAAAQSGRLRDLQDFGHLTGARPTSHQASATPHQCRG